MEQERMLPQLRKVLQVLNQGINWKTLLLKCIISQIILYDYSLQGKYIGSLVLWYFDRDQHYRHAIGAMQVDYWAQIGGFVVGPVNRRVH